MMLTTCTCSPLYLFLLSAAFVFGPSSRGSPLNYGKGSGNVHTIDALDRFRALKYGMFMHNGPVTQWGTEISFPLVCTSFPCSPKGPGNVDVNISTPQELKAHREKYAALSKTWNPSRFNATDIAIKAKAAGFKYLVYTTVHCDGFANWPSNVTAYNVMNTPFGRDLYGELVDALRAHGLLVGAYVCPSLWNNDDYWAPDASTANGPVCAPNYNITAEPDRWGKYVQTMHGMVQELVERYAPDLFWIDCNNAPPNTDTRIEALLAGIRNANSGALVMTRNGVFSDYVDLTDQSEANVKAIMGQAAIRSGVVFEVGTVLQESKQWAFDPNSLQKDPSQILANLMMIAAKGGNYLVNVAPGPTGEWPPSALRVLEEMHEWMDANREAFGNATSPMYPYECVNGECFLLQNDEKHVVYVLVPSMSPGKTTCDRTRGTPTGKSVASTTIIDNKSDYEGSGNRERPSTSTHAVMKSEGMMKLPMFRTDLLDYKLTHASILGLVLSGVLRLSRRGLGFAVGHHTTRSIAVDQERVRYKTPICAESERR
eukprot:g3408.t1